MSIWRWRELGKRVDQRLQASLGEGDTATIASRRISAEVGLPHLWFKLESGNPTGSYKDRFAAAAISHMRETRKRRCVTTSSGNTGSALAAYCAAYGLDCHIAIVEGAPAGKLVQMLAYGAQLFRVRGFGFDPLVTERTFSTLEAIGRQQDASLQISAYRYSPDGMVGVQTISYELATQLDAIDHVFTPAGGGGLTWAVAKGFRDLVENGCLPRMPGIHCVQPEGNATITAPLRAGGQHAVAVQSKTRISGLQVPTVIDGDGAIAACRESAGTGFTVSDDEVFQAQRRMARSEGIFCEPAGAVALAGCLKALATGEIDATDSCVCLVTGSGFKDLAAAEAMCDLSACPLVDDCELSELMSSRPSGQV
ncbi:MAG: pyridoxal-phosphate dependent enzyme [Pirellulales bacterium]|nr:pyridoxal-phosphate dependent enzyme [Pirellulales bacterium]